VPGTGFGYSGLGYVFLLRAVGRLTGLNLQQFMRERVFLPLGMDRSSYVWIPAYEALAAVGHDAGGKPRPKSKPEKGNPASSLHSTPREYAAFARLLLDFTRTGTPGDLSRDSLAALAEPVSPVTEGVSWGLGIGTEATAAGRVLWQWGDNGPFKAFVAVARDLGVGVVVMTNGQHGLKLCRRVIETCLPFHHPAADWLSGFYGSESKAAAGGGAERSVPASRLVSRH